MFKVGMIVACFYVWSGQDANVPDNSMKSDPMRLVAKVLAVHKLEKLDSNAKPDDSISESTKKEQTFLELEADSKKIRYFINANACKPSPLGKLTDDGVIASIKPDNAEKEKIEQKVENESKGAQPEVPPTVIEEQVMEEKKEEPKKVEEKEKSPEANSDSKKIENKSTQDNVLKDVTKDILRGIGF